MAFVRREQCGCVVGVCVEDANLHYAQTLANWARGGLSVEKLSIDEAREEWGNTIERIGELRAAGQKVYGHPKGPCRPVPRQERRYVVPRQAIDGDADAIAEAALRHRGVV
jgi:hypothetical protein